MEYKSKYLIIPPIKLAIVIFLTLIVQTTSIAEQNEADTKVFFLEFQILAHSLDGYFGTPTLVGLNYQNPKGGIIIGARNMSGSYSDSNSYGLAGSTFKGTLDHQELEIGYSFLTAKGGRFTPLLQFANGKENFTTTKYYFFNPPVTTNVIRSYDAIQTGIRYYFPSINPTAGAYISAVLTNRDYSDGSSEESSYLDFVGYSSNHNLTISLKLGGEKNSNYLGIGLIF